MATRKHVALHDQELDQSSISDIGNEGLIEPYDIDHLYTTWRNLANEQVMFPLDMSSMPVKIGIHRQLFLDNYLIAESEDVTREVHKPHRFEANPIMSPPGPKPNTICEHRILRFETEPHFRMWYSSNALHHLRKCGQDYRHAISYAISNDGVHWERPNLDLYQIAGTTERNIVIPYGLAQGLFHDPEEPDAQKRFKALLSVEFRKNGKRTVDAYYLHTSPDGIHWEGDLSHHVFPKLRGYTMPQGGIGDTTLFWTDSLRKKYIGDIKFVLPGKIRCRGITESDDLVHWSRPTPTLFPRQSDQQIYGHCGVVYQGMYLGMRWIFVPDYSIRHSSYVELDCSRDGRVWSRVGAGQPFMSFNPNHDRWDATIMRPNVVLEVEDEIWIYYYGGPSEIEIANPNTPEAHRLKDIGFLLGLAKVKRDRFVSLNAGPRTGTLLTRPLNFQGKTLHINAAIATGGELSVAVVSRDGEIVNGYAASECHRLQGDSIDIVVSWPQRPNLKGMDNSALRLQFKLKNAKLFSFWIE